MRDYLINMGIVGVVGGGISESGIVWIVGMLAALPTLLFCANQAKNLFTRKPALRDEFRTTSDCNERCKTANTRHNELSEKIDRALDKLDREFNERMTAMSTHSANSRKALYESVKQLSADVAAIKTADEIQRQQLASLGLKLDRVIENFKHHEK